MITRYYMTDNDRDVVSSCEWFASDVLASKYCPAEAKNDIKLLLRGLRMMPFSNSEIDVSLSVSDRYESKSVEIRLGAGELRISSYGKSYDPECGSDSWSDDDYVVDSSPKKKRGRMIDDSFFSDCKLIMSEKFHVYTENEFEVDIANLPDNKSAMEAERQSEDEYFNEAIEFITQEITDAKDELEYEKDVQQPNLFEYSPLSRGRNPKSSKDILGLLFPDRYIDRIFEKDMENEFYQNGIWMIMYLVHWSQKTRFKDVVALLSEKLDRERFVMIAPLLRNFYLMAASTELIERKLRTAMDKESDISENTFLEMLHDSIGLRPASNDLQANSENTAGTGLK